VIPIKERQKVYDKKNKAADERAGALLAFLFGMLTGAIIGLYISGLSGNPTTDAPPPDGKKKKKGK
jgi:hypothetical protein